MDASKIPAYAAGLGITGAAGGAAVATQAGETEMVSELTPVLTSEEVAAEEPVVVTPPPKEKEKTTLFEDFWYASPGFTSWNDWYFGKGSAIENVSIDSIKTASDLVSSSSSARFFDGANQKDVRSSLRIMTSKRKYYNKKFESVISWFWSLRVGNKGFIAIANAETIRARREWNMKGGFYLVEKGRDNKWHFRYKQEVNKGLDFKVFHKYFPRQHWYTKKNAFSWDKWYTWNFSNGAKELYENTCSGVNWSDNCWNWKSDTANTAGRWEWTGGQWYQDNCARPLDSGWCNNVWNWSNQKNELPWWNYMFGDNHSFKIMRVITPFFKGSWQVSSFKSWDNV